MQTEGQPYEDTVRGQPSISQGEKLRKKPTLLTLWFWTCSLRDCETVIFCCSSPPVCGTFLWQPELTNVALLRADGDGPWEWERVIVIVMVLLSSTHLPSSVPWSWDHTEKQMPKHMHSCILEANRVPDAS